MRSSSSGILFYPQALRAVCVRVNHTFNTLLFGQWPPPPVEVETFRRGVELDPCPGTRCCIEDFWDINLIGISFQEQSASWMRQHCNKRILQGPDHAPGHVRFT